MYLQLVIDEKEYASWYFDETIVFKHHQGSFRYNCELHEQWLQKKVLEIKGNYWFEIESSQQWSIRLIIKSKLNRYYHQTDKTIQ